MDRPLNSDALGKLGEKEFEGLCVRADLVPNPSTWDRKGWDFVVDWRESGSQASYDMRPSPFSCLIQVKTVWTQTPSIRLRLSSIAHLAQDLKPAFVVVLKIVDDLSVAGAAIAHLQGDLLAHILKRLRQASAEGKTPNAVEFDLPISRWFTPMPPNHIALRQALEVSIGPSMETYAANKQAELRDLGFDRGRFVLKGNLVAADEEALIDGFLGLRSLELVDAAAVEVRFDIALPVETFGGAATYEIELEAADTCQVLLRHPERSTPFTFPGRMIIPPAELFSPGRRKMLIRTDHFALTLEGRRDPISDEAHMEAGLIVEGGLPDRALGVGDWPEVYGFLASLTGQEPHRLEIHPDALDGPFTGTVGINIGQAASQRLARAAALAQAAQKIFARAGRPTTTLTFRALDAVERPLRNLGHLLTDPSRIVPLQIITATGPGFDPAETLQLYCCHHIQVGEHLIAYVVLAEMVGAEEDDRIHWRSRDLKVVDLSCLRPGREHFEAYVDGTLKRLAAVNHCIAEYDEPPDTPVLE